MYSTSRVKVLGQKRQRLTEELDKLTPIVFATINTLLGKERLRAIKVLLDSGASGSIMTKGLAAKLRVKLDKATQWNTAAGIFNTTGICKATFALPELSPSAEATHKFHVHDGMLNNYDMIIGRDLLKELGIDVCFSDHTVRWPRMNAVIPMKPMDCTIETEFHVQERKCLDEEADRNSTILDAKYSPADLAEVSHETKHLSESALSWG